jgi:hypothetical protein
MHVSTPPSLNLYEAFGYYDSEAYLAMLDRLIPM